MGALLNKKGQPCGVNSLPLLLHGDQTYLVSFIYNVPYILIHLTNPWQDGELQQIYIWVHR